MADNTTLNSGSGGDVIASDDLSGVKYQRVKVNYGEDGYAQDVSPLHPMPVGLPWGSQDTFGNIKTVNAFNEIDVQFFRDTPANLLTISGTGGTAVTTRVNADDDRRWHN